VSLVGVELDGDVVFLDDAILYDSSFANLGTISLEISADVEIDGVVTLAGGGLVEFLGANRFRGVLSPEQTLPKLVNLDNTFRAAQPIDPAHIGEKMIVENYGIMEANGLLSNLSIHLNGPSALASGTASWRNRGVVRALNKGRLYITYAGDSRKLDNVGGVIEFDAQSTIQFYESHIIGGTIRSLATAPILGQSLLGVGNFGPTLENVRFEGVTDWDTPFLLLGNLENTGTSYVQGITLTDDEATLNGGGVIEIDSIGGGGLGPFTPPKTLINIDNTIRLNGSTYLRHAHLVNRGKILSNDTDSSTKIVLSAFPFGSAKLTNSGLIEVVDGDRLSINRGDSPIVNYELEGGSVLPGLIQVDAESEIQLGSVSGGVLQVAEGGVMQVGVLSGPVEAGDIHLLGKIEVSGTLSGTIRNDGQLTGSFTSMDSTHTRLIGNGELLAGHIEVGDYATFTNGPDHTIATGEGDGTIRTRGNLLVNEGRIEARNGNTLRIEHAGAESAFQQRGQLVATGGGDLIFSNQPSHTRVLRFANDGLLVSETGSTISIHIDELFTNRGTVRIEPDATLTVSQTFRSPTFAQTAMGVLEIALGGSASPAEYGRLEAATAVLDGTLAVTIFDLGTGKFVPQLGDSFQILTTDEGLDPIAGQFASLSLPDLATGLFWQLDYLPHSVDLSVIALTTDLDLDHDVDGGDFLAIQRTDPTLIAQWQTEFGTHVIVTGGGAQLAVPEPATLVLLALSACLSGALRRR